MGTDSFLYRVDENMAASTYSLNKIPERSLEHSVSHSAHSIPLYLMPRPNSVAGKSTLSFIGWYGYCIVAFCTIYYSIMSKYYALYIFTWSLSALCHLVVVHCLLIVVLYRTHLGSMPAHPDIAYIHKKIAYCLPYTCCIVSKHCFGNMVCASQNGLFGNTLTSIVYFLVA